MKLPTIKIEYSGMGFFVAVYGATKKPWRSKSRSYKQALALKLRIERLMEQKNRKANHD